MAEIMKALGHPVRLQILEILGAEGEACVCHLEARLGQRQAYISQHLAKLRDAGLVADRREGLNVFYGVDREEVIGMLAAGRRMVQAMASEHRDPVEFGLPREIPPEACSCPKCQRKVMQTAGGG